MKLDDIKVGEIISIQNWLDIYRVAEIGATQVGVRAVNYRDDLYWLPKSDIKARIDIDIKDLKRL